jgi:hypothetical protein
MGGFGNSFGGWPYNADPAQYIQQATSQQPMPGTTPPNFRSQWYQPPNQQSPLRDQLVALFGNALMSQQAFPQIIQSLMQNPAAARGQLGLLSAPQSYSPDQNFWRINWNNPPAGGSANTSAASGGSPVTGTRPVFYGSGNSTDSGSANGATGAAGAGSVGAGVGEGASVSGGDAGSVGAGVGGNAGTAAGTSDPGVGDAGPGTDSGTW